MELETFPSSPSVTTPPGSPSKERLMESTAKKLLLEENGSSSETELTTSLSRQLVFHDNEHDTADKTLLPTVEFVPPTEGTPAALALAANAQIKVSKLDRVTHKFRSLKRPKMKSLNIMKKLNKTTKRRQERHFSKNFKGKVIDGLHELYTLTAGMMLGIRYCVGRSVNAPLATEDYDAVENVVFPPKGNTTPPYITPPHSLAHTFKFKSYAPRVFQKIREFYDIDAASYMLSVCGDYNFLEFISNSKSGQFFFYSHDGKYMLKTQTKTENKFLKRILPQYHAHIQQNPHSFITRILGMHRIKMYHLRRKVHFVIMASVFDTPAQIHRIYDLKGSMIGRRATEKERESGGVLKDCDLIDDGVVFRLGNKRHAFLAQIQKDAKFLASMNIMDYSLLVGVHNRDRRPLVGHVEPPPPPPSTHTVQNPHTHAETFSSVSVSVNNANNANAITASRVNSSSTVGSRGLLTVVSDMETSVVDNTHNKQQLQTQQHTQQHTHLLVNVATGVAEREGEREVERVNTTVGVRSNTPFRSSLSLTQQSPGSGAAPRAAPHAQQPSSQATHTHSNELAAIVEDERERHGEKVRRASSASPAHSRASSVDERDSVEESEQEEDEDASCFDDTEVEFLYDEVDLGDSDDGGERRPQSSSAAEAYPALFPALGEHFGNGVTVRAPWTTRFDGGINAHGPHGREKEIYFMGIIDILQEYNVSKKTETIFKGLTNDVRQISSVDPVTYARRFIQFIESNSE